VSAGQVELVSSEDLLVELADVLAKARLRDWIPEETALLLRRLYAQGASFYEPGPSPQVCRDPRDDYLLALAAASEADYLVTRDEDLLALGRHGVTAIIYPARFLQLVTQSA
jgi:hypothetical protein